MIDYNILFGYKENMIEEIRKKKIGDKLIISFVWMTRENKGEKKGVKKTSGPHHFYFSLQMERKERRNKKKNEIFSKLTPI